MKSVLMKQLLPLFFFLTAAASSFSQNAKKANFGVDGELRANIYGTVPAAGVPVNGLDDWFNLDAGSGKFVIDTTGAASIVARYTTDMAFRRYPFYRTMRYPTYS